MKPLKSNLEQTDFLILNSSYDFIEPTEEVLIKDLFDDYEVDIDYAIASPTPEDRSSFNIYIKISVNRIEHPLPGYNITAEGVGLFQLTQGANLTEKEIKNLLNLSSVNIMINNIRNYIITLTSYGPLGKYTLPTVDILDLVGKKAKLLKEEQQLI
jgi:preprotein translocase subunit SecB